MVKARDLAILRLESKRLALVLAPAVGGSIKRLHAVTETGIRPCLLYTSDAATTPYV